MKNLFHRLFGFPMGKVVVLFLGVFTTLLLFASETSFDFYAFVWVCLAIIYFVPRIGISLWRGTMPASDWVAVLAIPHVFALLAIMWGPLHYPSSAYAVEMLDTEFWTLPTAFIAFWLLLCVLITLRNKAVNCSRYGGLRWGGVIAVCAVLLLLADAAYTLTQAVPIFFDGLGGDMPLSTKNLLAGSPYLIYGNPVFALILGSSAILFSGRRKNVSAGAFDGLIALLAISNIGSVIGLLVLFSGTFLLCGSFWKPDEISRARTMPARLHTAAMLGHTESVKRISEKHAWISKQVLGDALNYAVIGNQKEIVRILIAKNADVRVQTKTGETALHTAARLAHIDLAMLLLESGAELNPISLQGTPLDVAEYYKAEGVRKVLLERGAFRATDAQKKTQREHWDRRLAESQSERKSCTDAMGIRAFLENPEIARASPIRALPLKQLGLPNSLEESTVGKT